MQPPMTPMIDVTFLLLIFFILTMTFSEAEGLIPGTLPQGETGESVGPPAIAIHIKVKPSPADPTGVIYELKGENLQIRDARKLYSMLLGKKELSRSTKMPVVIEPWGNVCWEHVVNAFNQAVRAKFEKIGFATAT